MFPSRLFVSLHRACGVLVLLAAGSALAQTDGTVATPVSGNWTALPWVITFGPGTYPDGGGTATILTPTTTSGVVTGLSGYVLNTPVTLGGIDFGSIFGVEIDGNSTNKITLSSTGGTLRALNTAAPSPNHFSLAGLINGPIAGGGGAGLTVTGRGGVIELGMANSYTGGTHISGGGMLVIDANDATLGATGAGNDISLDDGTLFNTAAFTTSRGITLGSGGGTILLNTGATVNGIISGSGDFTSRAYNSATLTLTAANTYTGATINSCLDPGTFAATPTLTLSSTGSILSSSRYDFGGNVNLNSTLAIVNNRLSDTAPITSRGATIALTGNATGAVAETTGALTLAGGQTVLSVSPGSVQTASLNLASITRQGAATLLVRGATLGGSGANTTTITTALPPGTLVGAGGAAGSKNISILPWALGGFSATANTNSRVVTWDSGTGSLRPLGNSEFATSLASAGATDNVLLTSGDTLASAATINSLSWNPTATGLQITGAGPLTITSGALIYSASTATFAGVISAGLDFGSAEGVVTNTSSSSSATSGSLTLSGPIAGSGGLTLSTLGSTIVLSGNSTYTGTTTILGGTVRFGGTVAADGVTPGPFGQGTSAIVLQPGTLTTQLIANAAGTVLNRDLSVRATGIGIAVLSTASAGNNLDMKGAIDLQYPLLLSTAANTAASGITLDGPVTGISQLLANTATYVTLNNAGNTFSGGLSLYNGTLVAGADNAFGTGTLYVYGNGAIQSADSTAHTFGNGLYIGAIPNFQGTGSLTFTGPLDLNGAATITVTMTGLAKTTFSGEVKNGSLTKIGPGWLNLARPEGNTYTGGTVLGASAGTLTLSNTSGSATGAGALSIGTGSTLAGSFLVSGATRIDGSFYIGHVDAASNVTAGPASFGGNLTLGSGAATYFTIDSAASYSTLTVGGTLTLDGILHVASNGYTAQWGDSFHIIGWSVIDASGFNVAADLDLSSAPVASGQYWDTTNFLLTGTITAIPEPGETAAAFVALLGVSIVLRRRRA